MAYIEWLDEYNVGIDPIDAQHQRLVQLLNALYLAIGPHTDPSVIWSHLVGFNSYADTHFQDEEQRARLARIDEKAFEAHAAIHASYKARLQRFHDRLSRGERGVGAELLAFLTEWWMSHIQGDDRRLAQLILARAEGPLR